MIASPAWEPDDWAYMMPEERAFAEGMIDDDGVWHPHPDNFPQQIAYECQADIIGYGGAAGGGKTDLGLGLALNKHVDCAIFRREGPQLLGIRNRLTAILGNDDGYNGRDNVWRNAGPRNVYIEFGSTPHPGDENKYQGRAKDFLLIEEAANFLASQVRFLMGWVRTTIPGQKCTTLMTFNPPTNAEGQWIIQFFAPWLDKKFPNKAKPGELRWAASLPASEKYPMGRDIWLDDGTPFVLVDEQPVFDFDPDDFDKEDIITPKTRTFISARVSDNPYLMGTGYMSTLQALPEPLRSQMLKGDFTAGMEDDPWQLIPSAWIELAMDRWKEQNPKPPMDALGCDVARGGKDNTILIPKHEGLWFDYPQVHPGKTTPDGPKVAGLCMGTARDGAVVQVDVIGVGASVYDCMNSIPNYPVVGVDVRHKATSMDKSGKLHFYNMRSQIGWLFRELLDPANNTGITVAPDPRLKAELLNIKWELRGIKIYIESREDIIARTGVSPDHASAIFLAAIDTPKSIFGLAASAAANYKAQSYDPYQGMGGVLTGKSKEYNPYENM